MSLNDRTLERKDRDWRLYVADFPADTFGDGFVAARLHINPGTPIKARQFPKTDDEPAYVTVEFGPHATVFLSLYQARVVHEALQFSAGASEGASPFAYASGGEAVTGTSPAPAEPSDSRECER